MTVQISPNIKKQRAFVNVNGDEVKPYTHEVIRSANEGMYIPTKEELEAVTKKGNEPSTPSEPTVEAPKVETSAMTIQQQIDQAKENLAKLEELKKLKILEMKAQLELLESE